MKDREYYFRHHLQTMPVSLACWRAFESERYARELFAPPVLDVGCGDGLFVQAVFSQPLDVGIDLDPEEIRKAALSRSYHEVRCADVTKLPFESDRFQTVMSNCVLEHIPAIDDALREIARVLKPGGRLMFTVPSEHYSRAFFWDAILTRMRFPGLGRKYVDGVNRMFRHYNLNDKATWEARLRQAGLEMEKAEKFISQAAARQLERWLPVGVPSMFWKKFFGRRVLMPRFLIRWFAPRWFRKSMWAEDPNGVCYLITARKP